jgi:hypothetical protein
MREVVLTKEKHIQIKNLGKVYAWYNGKLEILGQMTNDEKDEDDALINPNKIVEIQKRKEER